MGKVRETIVLFLKGVGMGSADVVPGVSGGTIALITGIYERLLESIRSVDLDALKLLFQLDLKGFWEKINGTFLITLLLGIATSILSFAKLITYLLKTHPIPVWSFFFGLIIVSAILIVRNIGKWKATTGVALIIGVAIAYLITEATPASTPESLWFIFLSGAIAICAMILPGISGSFILLIMGKYQYIFNALSEKNIVVIAVFMAGCITGLLSFARVISWLFKKYHDLTLALLSGFMIGSLNKVWPWKIPLEFRMNSHGEQVAYITDNVLPGEYYRQLSENPLVFQAILFIALGIFLVVAIEKIAKYKNP
ncbi:DUF368 domain-containing protein [Fulvivirga sp. M361]|uniref:DUF368 domain-containing protein n=1 Tax=Fulvivirga sp. M361 TaxID=2594266 RepID=UPI00117B7560|nr:DUF368 domain-containing protein [Fulvivirga sp. M361]TRX48198.1 DUF368 domain-containing protein [Fulvivirga sp. M361]